MRKSKRNKGDIPFDKNWRHKTIEDLENRNFGDPNEAPTNMVRRCIQLCKVPVGQFTVENLRLMIGQKFSFPYLVPLAIEYLKQDLFAEGDLYPGDLLEKVLSVDPKFWVSNKHLWEEVNELIKNSRDEIASHKFPLTSFDTAINSK